MKSGSGNVTVDIAEIENGSKSTILLLNCKIAGEKTDTEGRRE